VFDPACLQHRHSHYCDWWSDPDEELKDVRAGHALFVCLGADGRYVVDVSFDSPKAVPAGAVVARLLCRSGVVFVGPGEDTPGEGSRPGTRLGGHFFSVQPGTYEVVSTRPAFGRPAVAIVAVSGSHENEVADSLELPITPE
jgi:hypothetical protein